MLVALRKWKVSIGSPLIVRIQIIKKMEGKYRDSPNSSNSNKEDILRSVRIVQRKK